MSVVMGSAPITFNGEEMEKPEEHHKQEEEGGETNEPHGAADSKDSISKKHSYASVSNDEDGDAEEEEGKIAVLLGPPVPLKEHLELDKDDESLRRWKEQLLGSVDLTDVGENPDPEVQIHSLTILTPDRPDLVLPIPFIPDAKGYAFALKDDSKYRLKFSFVVSNNIVSGLRYTNTVWKTGVRVENSKVMLGTFSPQKEPYTYELEEETTPSGIFARGSYSARTKFVDDDGKCYLDISYYFEIRKDWPST